MRLIRYAWLILIRVLCSAASAGEPTVAFDPEQLSLSGDYTNIGFSDFRLVPINQNLCLPARSYLIELQEDEQATMVRAISMQVNSLASVEPVMLEPDIPTMAEQTPGEIRPALVVDASMIEHPLRVLGEVQSEERRFADVMLFPVTADESGMLAFHEKIVLFVGERPISPEELVRREDQISRRPRPARQFSAMGDGSAVDYVIVTSVALADAFAPLLPRYLYPLPPQ